MAQNSQEEERIEHEKFTQKARNELYMALLALPALYIL